MSMGVLKHSILGIHRKGYRLHLLQLLRSTEPTNSAAWTRFTLRRPFLREFRGSHIGSELPSGHQRWQTKKPMILASTGSMYQSVYINGPSTGHQRATYRASVFHIYIIWLELTWKNGGVQNGWQKKGFLGMGQSSSMFMGHFPSFWARDAKGLPFQAQRQIKTQGQVIRPVQRQAPGGNGPRGDGTVQSGAKWPLRPQRIQASWNRWKKLKNMEKMGKNGKNPQNI